MEHPAEAQDESRASDPWDPFNNKLAQELTKESQFIKEDKLWEVYLYNID